MNRWIFISFIPILILGCNSTRNTEKSIPKPPFSVSENSNRTPTYGEGISWWKKLAKSSRMAKMIEYGATDAGIPLHLVILDFGGAKPLKKYAQRKKQLLLINNAIHPGEPDGVDASMLLAHKLLTDENIDWRNTVLAIIPFYNVGGALRRNSHTRANQNGPESYGFRGNAQNLDLNRDFIKCDSRNAESFTKLIVLLDPELYIETHVSNGADYQYTITYLPAQEDKIGKPLGEEYRKKWTPFLQQEMRNSGFPMVPYVNVHGVPPDNGYATFYDSPRYSTGMLTLHHIPGYITETHMLKPYNERVKATFQFLLSGVKLMKKYNFKLPKSNSRTNEIEQDTLPIHWRVVKADSANASVLDFKGFEHGYKPSEVTGQMRLYYNRDRPVEKEVVYFEQLEPTQWSIAPEFYLIRAGYHEVVDRLIWNGVEVSTFKTDTTMRLRVTYISKTESLTSPYEGHFLHYNTRVRDSIHAIPVFRGDVLVRTNTAKRRFLVNTLDPRAPDSYFNWNFFDPILQRKEYFSSYVFEDLAAELLSNDPKLKKAWDTFKKTPQFQQHKGSQLHWIYAHSRYSEPTYLQYPVYQSIN